MLTKEMHKQEVEKELEGKGDFVKIDYLNRYLKLMPPLEMRKFAYLKLAEIYDKKGMFSESANAYKNASSNTMVIREKLDYFVEEAKSYAKSLDFVGVDKAIKSAFSEANSIQREEINQKIKIFYKEYAQELEKQVKRNAASRVYERLLKMSLSGNEKEEIKRKLKALYEKLGKVREIKFLEGI